MARPETIATEAHALAVTMRQAGQKLEEIEATTGISKARLRTYFMKAGVTGPAFRPVVQREYLRAGRLVRPFTRDEDERLMSMRKNGLTLSAMGQALGRHAGTVRARLQTLARKEAHATPAT